MSIDVLAVLGRGLVDPSTPIVRADDEGLTRGDGCFEGCRIRRRPGGPVVDSLDRHLARLARSASALDICCEPPVWEALVAEAAAAWADRFPDRDEAALKLVLTRGTPGGDPTGFASVFPMGPAIESARRDGIAVVTLARGTRSDSYAAAPWLLGGVKTISYAVNMAGGREAARRQAADVIFVTLDGLLLEAPTSSVVWYADGVLRTIADGPNGVLHSITTEVLLERADGTGRKTDAGAGTVEDLYSAELVMLVSSTRGPVRIHTLDDKPLLAGSDSLEILTACRQLTDFA